jgi:hypothetical protein
MNPLLLGAGKEQLRGAELRRRSEASTERRHGEACGRRADAVALDASDAMGAGVVALVVALFGLIVAP